MHRHTIGRPSAWLVGSRRQFALSVVPMLAGWSSTWASVSRRFAVDDTGSRVLWQSAPSWEWPVAGKSSAITRARVALTLDLAGAARRRGALSMRLSPATPDGVDVKWSAAGRFRPGRLSAGKSALLYEGLLPSRIVETLNVIVRAPAELSRATDLSFTFEAEVRE